MYLCPIKWTSRKEKGLCIFFILLFQSKPHKMKVKIKQEVLWINSAMLCFTLNHFGILEDMTNLYNFNTFWAMDFLHLSFGERVAELPNVNLLKRFFTYNGNFSVVYQFDLFIENYHETIEKFRLIIKHCLRWNQSNKLNPWFSNVPVKLFMKVYITQIVYQLKSSRLH